MTTAFPLQWPAGWPRTPPGDRQDGRRFRHGNPWETRYQNGESKSVYVGRKQVTFAKSRDKLYAELERLGASDVVISSNHKPDVRGVPIESKRAVDDEGIAVYFRYKGKPMVMASDRFDSAAANMRSIGLAIDAMRQLERHGGGFMLERAFTGFEALPAPKHWSSILGVTMSATREQILQSHRDKVKRWHAEGRPEQELQDLNVARDQALEAMR